MKKFTVQCDFGGQTHPVQVYIGEPDPELHPLKYQAQWLAENKGGVIPNEVMESFSKLQNIAKEHGVNFEELCMEALGKNDSKQENKTQPSENQ